MQLSSIAQAGNMAKIHMTGNDTKDPEMIAKKTDIKINKVYDLFCNETGYTPVDKSCCFR